MMGLSTAVAALMPTMILIALATGIYVIVGGLLAVALTDAIQTTTLLLGSAIVTWFAFSRLGGWQPLYDSVGPHMLSVLRPTGDFSGMPWHAVVLGYPVIGIWYWCTDQTIVQRVLGAKNEDHGKAGALFAGFLKLLPMFLFVLPGLLCLALVNNGLLPPLADTKKAFAHMVMNLLPAGFRGLIVAGLLAALMGTIAGALNSIATLFAFDLYKRFKPATSDKKLVHIGRLATVAGVILAIIWSPIIGKFDSIYNAIASMICYIAPPITAVFMVGIFWKRATARAGAVTLWSGFAMGMIIFALDLFKAHTGWSMLFMHTAGMLCGICILIMIVASLLDKDTNTEENLKLVWDSPLTPLRIKGVRGVMNYKFLSVVVMMAAGIIYFLFRAPSAEKLNAWKSAHPENAAKIEVHINPK
jgi:SSS family solute:Na+ symporter